MSSLTGAALGVQVCKAWEAVVTSTVSELWPSRTDPGLWRRMSALERLHLGTLRYLVTLLTGELDCA